VIGVVIGRDVTREEELMTNRTYRITEIVGTSPDGVDAAIRSGLARAAQTLRHIDWFEVTSIRGQIDSGEIQHVQVSLKLGFRLEDA
jgi:flavin-binding protein dodecin